MGGLESHLYGVYMSTRTRDVDIEAIMTRWLDQLGAVHLFTVDHHTARGFVASDFGERLAELAESFKSYGGHTVSLGLSRLTPIHQLSTALHQAKQAHDLAVELRRRTALFDTVPTIKQVLGDFDAQSR